MDRVEPDTQPTPRPRSAQGSKTKRAAPAAADPRVATPAASTSATSAKRSNGASSRRRRPPTEPVVDVDSSVELPSPVLPTIVPARVAVADQPDTPEAHGATATVVDDELPAFPVEAPLRIDLDPSADLMPDPVVEPEPLVEPEPVVTFVDPTTMEAAVEPPKVVRAPRRASRPRVRRVTRVVRHVDTWSVFKVALVFNLLLYAVCLTSGVLLWHVASATGTVDNAERFFEQFGWSTFEFHGGEIYHSAWIAGLFVIVGLTGFAVLLATLFNLITDLVGGIRVSVLEEEVVARSWGGLGTVLRRDDLDPEPPVDGDELPDRVPRHPF